MIKSDHMQILFKLAANLKKASLIYIKIEISYDCSAIERYQTRTIMSCKKFLLTSCNRLLVESMLVRVKNRIVFSTYGTRLSVVWCRQSGTDLFGTGLYVYHG